MGPTGYPGRCRNQRTIPLPASSRSGSHGQLESVRRTVGLHAGQEEMVAAAAHPPDAPDRDAAALREGVGAGSVYLYDFLTERNGWMERCAGPSAAPNPSCRPTTSEGQ